jgi:hypothetical protein
VEPHRIKAVIGRQAGVVEVVELVVVACLIVAPIVAPTRCEAFHVPFLRTLKVSECVAGQQTFEIVRWARAHPGWTIKKWTCAPPRA